MTIQLATPRIGDIEEVARSQAETPASPVARFGRLYIMDEAQNFAPSGKSTAASQSTAALAAQARKYGLGMIFATQLPKGIDNRIVGNCTTQFYGKQSAPVTIQAAKDMLAARGGGGDDIARLTRAHFYFSTEGHARPIKVQTPLCLSFHPANPLSPEEVEVRARRGRAERNGA